MASEHLKSELQNVIENIPDFPQPGIQFKDISPIFLRPDLYSKVVEDLADFSRGKIDIVCGIESRGFLFGIALAVKLNVPFILIRKKGKLPPPLVSQKYNLEYGSAEIEMKAHQLKPNQRVLVHDDLLATGGTTEAAAMLVEKQGAKVAQFSFVIALQQLEGRKRLEKFSADVYSLLTY